MPGRIRRVARAVYEVGRDAVSSYGHDRGGRMAAALAYRTLFAVAPLLLLAIGTFGLVIGDPEEARDIVVRVIGTLVGPEVSDSIESLVVSAVQESDTTAIIGFGLFAWASSSLFMDLQMSLNDIFRVPREEVAGWRGMLRRRAVAIGWSLSFGVLLILSWLAGAVGGWLAGLVPPGFGLGRTVVEVGTRVLAFTLVPVVFVLMYRTMTRARLHRRALVAGGLITSIAFLATALVAGVYFSWDRETSAGQIAGSVVVLLLLAYFLSSAILMGAEATRALHDRLERT